MVHVCEKINVFSLYYTILCLFNWNKNTNYIIFPWKNLLILLEIIKKFMLYNSHSRKMNSKSLSLYRNRYFYLLSSCEELNWNFYWSLRNVIFRASFIPCRNKYFLGLRAKTIKLSARSNRLNCQESKLIFQLILLWWPDKW